jgi:hypothetical protein
MLLSSSFPYQISTKKRERYNIYTEGRVVITSNGHVKDLINRQYYCLSDAKKPESHSASALISAIDLGSLDSLSTRNVFPGFFPVSPPCLEGAPEEEEEAELDASR